MKWSFTVILQIQIQSVVFLLSLLTEENVSTKTTPCSDWGVWQQCKCSDGGYNYKRECQHECNGAECEVEFQSPASCNYTECQIQGSGETTIILAIVLSVITVILITTITISLIRHYRKRAGRRRPREASTFISDRPRTQSINGCPQLPYLIAQPMGPISVQLQSILRSRDDLTSDNEADDVQRNNVTEVACRPKSEGSNYYRTMYAYPSVTEWEISGKNNTNEY